MAHVEADIKCIASLACIAVFVSSSGCSTASSLGLPVASGPHELMPVAKHFRDVASLPVPLPRELAKGVVPEYRVEPGDVLLVEPDSFDSAIRLPSDQPVQPDGTIELGRFGRLPVTGKTVSEIEVEVRETITRQLLAESPENVDGDEPTARNGSVSVRLLTRESKVFYVVGEVNAPGNYPLVGRETILDAIMTAGGLTDKANEHKLIFVRPTAPENCRIVLPVCYRQIVQLGDTSTNYQVMPGDRIYVPSLTFHDDVKQFLKLGHEDTCPRCIPAQTPCLSGPGCRHGSACTRCRPGSKRSR